MDKLKEKFAKIYNEIIDNLYKMNMISISIIQREYKTGFSLASSIIDKLIENGYVRRKECGIGYDILYKEERISENVIKINPNFGKMTTRDNIGIYDVELIKEDGTPVENEIKDRALKLLYSCTAFVDSDKNADDIFSFSEQCEENVMFAIDPSELKKLFLKCNNKVAFSVYTANNGEELFEGLRDIHSYYIYSIIIGKKDASLEDIFMFEKHFVENVTVTLKIDDLLESNYKVVSFYEPIKNN